MRDSIYLLVCYLGLHKIKTAILVVSITLIVYLPVGLSVLVNQSATRLTQRALESPLLVGKRGSPLSLVLSSLYFETESPDPLLYSEVTRISESGLALPIPLDIRFRARRHPVVGTTLDYFDFRGLHLARGRSLAILGECVLGAQVAETLSLSPGDELISTPDNVFNLGGSYPLKMKVVGVLASSHTPDDRVIFVDLKTSWVIDGLGHGHQDLTKEEGEEFVLKRNGDSVTANAAVLQYTEIDPENLESFHFHGDQETYPVTGILAIPKDEKSGVLLRGRYQGSEEVCQIVRPYEVMEDLLATVFTVRGFVTLALVLVGASTLLTALMVFLLSLRLRKGEIATLEKIGGERRRVWFLILGEMGAVLVMSVILATLLTLVTERFGETAIRAFLLQ